MSQKDITQNPKACQEKCKKKSWINFAMNSVILVLTIIERAILKKHSAKLFRQLFLHKRLHWEKKECSKHLWRWHLRSLWWLHWSGLLQGAVAEQGNEPPRGTGTEDGEGRGLPTEELLVLQSRTSVQHQNLCSDLQRPGTFQGPPEVLLYEASSHTQRGLELV